MKLIQIIIIVIPLFSSNYLGYIDYMTINKNEIWKTYYYA